MRYYLRCKECWFDIQTRSDSVLKRRFRTDDKKKQDKLMNSNRLDVPVELPHLEPVEELLIALFAVTNIVAMLLISFETVARCKMNFLSRQKTLTSSPSVPLAPI